MSSLLARTTAALLAASAPWTTVVSCQEVETEAGDAPASRRPNIVVVLTDDSGYSDLGCYGGEIATPNIDRLAEAGVRFRRCYTNGRCSPTRASLLTGQAPHTVGAGDLCTRGFWTDFPGYLGFLSPDYPTVAELLREAGYDTLMTGKWHLGGDRRNHDVPAYAVYPEELEKWPIGRGFRRFFGHIHGFTEKFTGRRGRPYFLGARRYDVDKHPTDFYATDAFTDFAIDFVENARQRHEKPIFLYLSFSAPHTPLEARDEDVRKYAATYDSADELLAVRRRRVERSRELGLVREDWPLDDPGVTRRLKHVFEHRKVLAEQLPEQMATYAAMMEVIDRNVGRLVDAFERLGELEDTLIVFLSDNGAPSFYGHVFNAPFTGVKDTLSEGAIVSHLVAHWPRGISKPAITDQVAHVQDLLPTFLELAGVEYPAAFRGAAITPPEGVSLLPTLTEGRLVERGDLAWELYGEQALLRDGRWKWRRSDEGVEQLFDLVADGGETENVAAEHPELVAEARRRFGAFAERTGVLPWEVVREAQRERFRAETGNEPMPRRDEGLDEDPDEYQDEDPDAARERVPEADSAAPRGGE